MEIFLLLILSGILRVIWILGDVLNIKNIRRKNWGALCFMREAKYFVHFFFPCLKSENITIITFIRIIITYNFDTTNETFIYSRKSFEILICCKLWRKCKYSKDKRDNRHVGLLRYYYNITVFLNIWYSDIGLIIRAESNMCILYIRYRENWSLKQISFNGR